MIWAQQAIDALLELKQAADAARAAGHGTVDAEVLEKQGQWFRDAVEAGIVLNAVIRMTKLRIKVSGCMRSMQGAEAFCAIRSYLASAGRHGISWLDALTMAARGTPWIPGTT